jgi:hypothetical protein
MSDRRLPRRCRSSERKACGRPTYDRPSAVRRTRCNQREGTDLAGRSFASAHAKMQPCVRSNGGTMRRSRRHFASERPALAASNAGGMSRSERPTARARERARKERARVSGAWKLEGRSRCGRTPARARAGLLYVHRRVPRRAGWFGAPEPLALGGGQARRARACTACRMAAMYCVLRQLPQTCGRWPAPAPAPPIARAHVGTRTHSAEGAEPALTCRCTARRTVRAGPTGVQGEIGAVGSRAPISSRATCTCRRKGPRVPREYPASTSRMPPTIVPSLSPVVYTGT